jgi:TrmH family RNA methyltransferase
MSTISSPTNPRIRELRQLQTVRGRKKSGLFLMEGPHLLLALLEARITPQEVYYQPELLGRTAEGRGLLARLLQASGAIEVSERVMEVLGETQSPQGVIAVMEMQDFAAGRLKARREQHTRPALLILDGLADPGNMGTILRTALAADVEAVLLTSDCVDYFSPKVVRSAAGAHVTLPVEADLTWQELHTRMAAHCAGRVLVAEADGERSYYQEDLRQPFALIIGNEAHGPSHEGRKLASTTISIPLFNAVESLNAAMASGIILYEAVRQRIEGNA